MRNKVHVRNTNEQMRTVEINGGVQQTAFAHFGRVNAEDLRATFAVGQTDLDVHFEAAWSQQRRIDQFFAIRHANHEDVYYNTTTTTTGW